jgi:predicted ester cyclase
VRPTFRVDLRRTVEDQIAEGERVVTRFTDHGSHQGELLGLAPTGREVAVQGINIQDARDGDLARRRPRRADSTARPWRRTFRREGLTDRHVRDCEILLV